MHGHSSPPGKPAPSATRVPIVEDDGFLLSVLQKKLLQLNCVPAGEARDYATAISFLDRGNIDLVLLDVRLAGGRTGIEVATYIQTMPRPVPFLYLTGEEKPELVEAARMTNPVGYLYKPVLSKPLLVSLEVAISNFRQSGPPQGVVLLNDNRQSRLYRADELVYLQAEHVYTRVVSLSNEPMLVRKSLVTLLEEFNDPTLLRTHRSYAVHCGQVTRYVEDYVYLGATKIPISRRRYAAVRQQLDSLFHAS